MLTKRDRKWIRDSFKSKYDLASIDGELNICGYENDQYCIFGYSGEIGGIPVYSAVCPIGNAASVFIKLENRSILELEEVLASIERE